MFARTKERIFTSNVMMEVATKRANNPVSAVSNALNLPVGNVSIIIAIGLFLDTRVIPQFLPLHGIVSNTDGRSASQGIVQQSTTID